MNTADQLDYQIVGDDFQAVVITLDPGEAVRAEPGAFIWMEDGVEMSTTTGGGLMKGLKRKIAGESFFVTSFTNEAHDRRDLSFAGSFPGKIIPMDLSKTGEMLCQRDSYLCSAGGVEVSMAFTKRLGAGMFGGEGFVLQRLRGDGLAFVHAGGFVTERELGAGETLRVDTGCVVAFEPSIDYDISMIKGVRSKLFGGEGLFQALLRGPGKVWLQSSPLSRFARRIMAASGQGEARRGFGVLGDMIGGGE